MAYVKNTWVDQEGQVRYRETQDGDFKILTPNYEQVTEIGTPVNADNMNHIEQGIADCYTYVDSKITEMLQLIYPVGSTYISTSSTNPLEALFGTWELVSAGRVLQGADENHAAGTTIAAGLPNHKHKVAVYYARHGEGGSGYDKGEWSNGDWDRTRINPDIYTVNASEDNSIYGNSDTVQPPAYVVNIWRRTA